MHLRYCLTIFSVEEWIQTTADQKTKGLLTAEFSFQHCSTKDKRDPSGMSPEFEVTSQKTPQAMNII